MTCQNGPRMPYWLWDRPQGLASAFSLSICACHAAYLCLNAWSRKVTVRVNFGWANPSFHR
jgi:hypothetical protein